MTEGTLIRSPRKTYNKSLFLFHLSFLCSWIKMGSDENFMINFNKLEVLVSGDMVSMVSQFERDFYKLDSEKPTNWIWTFDV